jgi:hypothetical protein
VVLTRYQKPIIKYKMPVIKGTAFNGDYMEMALDPSQFESNSIDVSIYAIHLPSITPSQCLCLRINRHQIPLARKRFKDISLLIQHKPICLFPNLRQTSPTLQISLDSVCHRELLEDIPNDPD